MSATTIAIKQHLIDPVICIRCNTCEAICPVKAITHDSMNYVVDADICNLCMACISPCPTGSIDNWRTMPKIKAYTPAEQLTWEDLPEEWTPEQLLEAGVTGDVEVVGVASTESTSSVQTSGEVAVSSSAFGSTLPPWSAAHAYTNLHGPKTPTTATVVGNARVTAVGKEYDTHHVVLDFGSMPFPVLEGQSIGILPPGSDDKGKPHHARQYSIASPRNGERPGYNNRQACIGGSPRQTRQGRGLQLCVRPESWRHGASGWPIWQQLFDAQPSALQHRDDLHRHR
jgi:benzoyl-CoA 2,3-epoxidase subunit A